MKQIAIVHEGRGGYVELEGYRYCIEMFAGGHFSIHFPNGNRHNRLQAHLEQLSEFAAQQDPKWAVENRSRKYRLSEE